MSEPAEFQIRDARVVHESGFLRLEELDVAAPDGSRLLRHVVRHPGAVAVVAVVGDEVALIRQYRAPVDEYLLELPAGKLDVPGEARAATAARELEEEVGLRPGRLVELASFYTGPGFTDEYMTVFLATECVAVPMAPHGLEEQHAEIVRIPVVDLPALLSSGEVRDAKTLAGLLAYLHQAR